MKAFILAIFTGMFMMMSIGYAGPYEYTGPWMSSWTNDYIPVQELNYIPTTWEVTGKEYSDNPDKNASEPPVSDPLQTLHWDGWILGGDFSAGRENGVDFGDSGEVDALAYNADAFFSAVVNNKVPLICSLTSDVAWNGTTTDCPLLWEQTPGTKGVWATDTYVDQEGVTDLDGIDLWHSISGGEQTSSQDGTDVNRYSLAGDPGGVAVFDAAGATVFTDSELAAAIAAQLSLDSEQEAELAAGMDVDAMMVSDDEYLLFSIKALGIAGYSFVGDEVWLYNDTLETVAWLNHGGHEWSTDWLGINVDGLEAVPEPATVTLLLLGGTAIFIRRKK